MKSIVINGDKMQFKESLEPQIKKPKDIKIKIKYSGICGTDLQVLKGNEKSVDNIIRGHEAVGEIVEIGSEVKNFKIKDRVAIDPNQYCGRCYYCKKGDTNFCESPGGFTIAGINIDGVFADYFVCDETFVYHIPNDMTWEQAVMIEPTACIYNNILAANVKPNDSVLIFGSGPMGAICEIICKKISKLVVAVETNDYRRNFCEKYVDYIYQPKDLTKKEMYRINDGHKFDVVFDTVGTQMENALLNFTEKNGRIVPIGMNQVYNFSLHPMTLISNGIKLVGASEYNMLFVDTINMLKRYKEIGELVTKKLPFEKCEEGFNSVLGFDMNTKKPLEITQMKCVFES